MSPEVDPRRIQHGDDATVVEKKMANDDKTMMYGYAIKKSPLPIKNYKPTIKVVPMGKDMSKVEWSST